MTHADHPATPAGQAARQPAGGALALLLASMLCLFASVPAAADARGESTQREIEIWHTFAVDSRNEAILLRAIEGFEAAHAGIDVRVTRIPYLQNLPQFINSSQGGEAPDVIRVSDTEVGKIGHISVEGLPLLEDLRPHVTPMQRERFDPRALAAMRYGDPLFALPVSQGCLSLIYNRSLFDAAGLGYPSEDWTTDDLLTAAKALTEGDVKGLALPLRWSYWLVPFIHGFGGQLFDSEARPTLDAPGTAAAVDWFLDLSRKHGVVTPGADIEGMSNQFKRAKAAMVLDGPWNWIGYREAGIDLGQAVMPLVAETGLRLGPMFSYFGWAVSKQSAEKVAAVELALWLSADEVQKEFALADYTLPTSETVWADEELAGNAVLSGFLAQTRFGVPVPTTRATSMIFEQLDTAIEMTLTGQMGTQAALTEGNQTLLRILSR